MADTPHRICCMDVRITEYMGLLIVNLSGSYSIDVFRVFL